MENENIAPLDPQVDVSTPAPKVFDFKRFLPIMAPAAAAIIIILIIGFVFVNSSGKSSSTPTPTPTPTVTTSIPATTTVSNTTSVPTTTISPITSDNGYKTFTESTEKWQIDYPSYWVVSKETFSGIPGGFYRLFQSPDSELSATGHRGLFAVGRNGGGYAYQTYDQCIQAISDPGGAAAGHRIGPASKLKVNGYDACTYHESEGDGNVNIEDTYLFVKNPSGTNIVLSYSEDSKSARHNYDIKDWIFSNTFKTMQNSFKFL